MKQISKIYTRMKRNRKIKAFTGELKVKLY